MKDSPIFFDFRQELHLIELCLIISLVCSDVPIHHEKINTLESKKSNNQKMNYMMTANNETFSFSSDICVNPHRCEIQQRCVVQRPEPERGIMYGSRATPRKSCEILRRCGFMSYYNTD